MLDIYLQCSNFRSLILVTIILLLIWEIKETHGGDGKFHRGRTEPMTWAGASLGGQTPQEQD